MSLFKFILACDFDRPEIEITCDLVYFVNNYRIPPSKVVFGDPSKLDPRPDIEDDINTYIPAVVDPKFDERLKADETGFMYTRIPLGGLVMVQNTPITPPALPFKTSDILSQINAQLGTQLTMNDLEEIEYTTLDDNFALIAKPTSKNWIDGRFLLVTGGGKKNILYPNELIATWLNGPSIEVDKKAQLASVANRDNGVAWTPQVDFTYGNMEPNITGHVGRNTRVFIKSLKEGYDDQWLYFVRVDPATINDQFGDDPVPEVVVPRGTFTTHEVLDAINSALNLHLTIDDVENTEYPPGLREYPIKFKPTSFGWLKGVYVMKTIPEELRLFNVRMVNDVDYRIVGPDAYRQYEDYVPA